MKVELPELKRCCCCIPLRYGLLTWAYIRVIVMILFGIVVGQSVYFLIGISLALGIPFIFEIFIAITLLLIIVADVIFTLVFLVGGHMKNIKVLRVYYTYSIVFLCIFTVLLLGTTSLQLYTAGRYSRSGLHSTISIGLLLKTEITTTVVDIAIQGYYILLLRSEISKLSNNFNFRFVNPALEAECTLENGTEINIESGTNAPGNEHNAPENRSKVQTNITGNGTNGHENGNYNHDVRSKDQGSGTYNESKTTEGESYNYKPLDPIDIHSY